LRARATEDEDEIEKRLDVAREQLGQADEFDHVVVNYEFDRAVTELEAIIRGELSAAGTILRP
jgi:guanylate kinase